jgi:hypothetical protein
VLMADLVCVVCELVHGTYHVLSTVYWIMVHGRASRKSQGQATER